LSADWESFAQGIDHVVQFILTYLDFYAQFSNVNKAAAKRHVSRGFRKEYILSSQQNCENLYQEYNFNHDDITANRLLKDLNKQRKKEMKRNSRKHKLRPLKPKSLLEFSS
jgi:hypothetical protein